MLFFALAANFIYFFQGEKMISSWGCSSLDIFQSILFPFFQRWRQISRVRRRQSKLPSYPSIDPSLFSPYFCLLHPSSSFPLINDRRFVELGRKLGLIFLLWGGWKTQRKGKKMYKAGKEVKSFFSSNGRRQKKSFSQQRFYPSFLFFPHSLKRWSNDKRDLHFFFKAERKNMWRKYFFPWKTSVHYLKSPIRFALSSKSHAESHSKWRLDEE